MIAIFQRQLKAALPISLANKWFAFGLVLVIVGIPLSRAALSIGVVWLSLGVFLPGESMRRLPVWLWMGLALFGLYLLGMLYSSDPETGLGDLWQKLPLITVPLALFRAEKLPARTVRGLLWLVVLTACMSVLAMLGIALWHSVEEGLHLALIGDCAFGGTCSQPIVWESSMDWLSYSKLAGTINQHPTFLSMYLMAGFLAIVWLWEDARKRSEPFSHWVMALFTGLIFLAIALLASRMQQGIFVLVLGVLGIGFLRGRMSRKELLIPGMAVVLVFAGSLTLMPESRDRVAQIFTQKEKPQSVGEWTGITVRREVWKSGWNLMGTVWATGVGTGDYRDALTSQYLADGFQYGYKRELDAHNQYLATAVALGLPGLLLLLLWLGSQMLTAVREGNHPWLLWTAIFVLGCVAETLLGRQIGVAAIAVIGPFLAFHLPKAGIVPGGEKEQAP